MWLKLCDIPEFQGSYQSINDHFSKIATLLNASDSKGDKMYKSAIKLFKFSEINGIHLGFSENEHGAGFGEKLRKQVISDAFDIVKKGVQYPEIFRLIRLFRPRLLIVVCPLCFLERFSTNANSANFGSSFGLLKRQISPISTRNPDTVES